jgi:release factor glutamine methyltransferase
VPETGSTVAALLDAAATRLGQAGVEEPRREAWRIWVDLHETTAIQGYADRELQPAAEVARTFRVAVDRRVRGEPLQYVTGLAGFRRLTLRCDSRALIPRPETEGLVDLLLARQVTGRVVDAGTGSGCIALALADEGQYDLVVGVDRSRPALGLAAENRTRTGLDVVLIGGDLLSPFGDRSFDAVVSNPPYLTAEEFAGLDPSVRAWEPVAALASGVDGLEATQRLVVDAARVTRPGGWLAMEVDTTRAQDVANLAAAAGWTEQTVHIDLFDRARYMLARRSEAE